MSSRPKLDRLSLYGVEGRANAALKTAATTRAVLRLDSTTESMLAVIAVGSSFK
jgi:hypothetical protein